MYVNKANRYWLHFIITGGDYSMKPYSRSNIKGIGGSVVSIVNCTNAGEVSEAAYGLVADIESITHSFYQEGQKENEATDTVAMTKEDILSAPFVALLNERVRAYNEENPEAPGKACGWNLVNGQLVFAPLPPEAIWLSQGNYRG